MNEQTLKIKDVVKELMLELNNSIDKDSYVVLQRKIRVIENLLHTMTLIDAID